MPVRFPAPWLMGVSSAGQQFTDAFLGARLMKLQRIKQQEEAQRHKEELAIRRQTMEELGEYRKSQAKHQETADFIHFLGNIAKIDPDIAARVMQTPEAKKMIPALGSVGPWVTGDTIGKAMESVRRMEEEYAARGLPMPPGLMETVITEAITGTKLPAGLFKERGAGGRGEGGGGGPGGGAGQVIPWYQDPTTDEPMAHLPTGDVPLGTVNLGKRARLIQIKPGEKPGKALTEYDKREDKNLQDAYSAATTDEQRRAVAAQAEIITKRRHAEGKPGLSAGTTFGVTKPGGYLPWSAEPEYGQTPALVPTPPPVPQVRLGPPQQQPQLKGKKKQGLPYDPNEGWGEWQ